MIDLNHILLFIAVVSPLILLARIFHLRNERNRGWRAAALLVLTICFFAWLFASEWAGIIGGLAWALLLLVPSLAERRIDHLFLAQRLPLARRLAVVRRMLHPWDDSPYPATLFRALELARAGQLDLALDRLAAVRAAPTPAGRLATALTFALTGNWPGLVQWCRRDLRVTESPALLSLYLRALGEIGATDDLILALAARPLERDPRFTMDARTAYHLALGLAFAGRTSEVVRLFQRGLAGCSKVEQEFWLGTAELAGGRVEAGRARLEKLRHETNDAGWRRAIERRLARERPLTPLSASGQMLLARLLTESADLRARPARRGAPAVWALILLNLAMFLVELRLGGSTNVRTLQELGGLEPEAIVVRQEYWRLLTALFLHYGPLHIGINLLGLYLLGPALERTIGSLKFVISYLLCGLGSGLGVVLLWRLGLTRSDLLVGASGAIMGVIGVSAGLLLRHRGSVLAGRQLRDIIAIVAIQTIFDLWSPQVSLAAHLGGFLVGVLLGVILATRARRVGSA